MPYPADYRELAQSLRANWQNFSLSMGRQVEFSGDHLANFGIRVATDRWSTLTVHNPERSAGLWFDVTDHGQIRSLRHAVAIVRADLIRTNYDGSPRAHFDADYPDSATIIRHVLDWAYMFESPGFDAEQRELRVAAAWLFIIDRSEDYDSQADFFSAIESGEER